MTLNYAPQMNSLGMWVDHPQTVEELSSIQFWYPKQTAELRILYTWLQLVELVRTS